MIAISPGRYRQRPRVAGCGEGGRSAVAITVAIGVPPRRAHHVVIGVVHGGLSAEQAFQKYNDLKASGSK